MNPFLCKTHFYLFCLLFVGSSMANDIEKVEVLAPKQVISIYSNNLTKNYVDGQYAFTLERTIADRLQTIPGVSLNGQGGQFQSYAIRGFSRARIRTEIDGIPIITDRRAGNASSFLSPDLFNLASVSKGPNSALYGSQALGGVVSLTTGVDKGTHIKLSGQSADNGVNVTLKHNKGKISSAISYQHANLSTAANGAALNSQYERASGLLRYENTHNQLTTIVSWLPSYGQNIGKSNIKYPNQEISIYPEEIHSLAQIQVMSANGWMSKFFHHYQNWDSETDRINQYVSLTEYQSQTLGGQWLNTIDIANFDIHLGLDWLSRKGVRISSAYDIYDTKSELNENQLNNQMHGDEDNLALFSHTKWQTDNTQFAIGLRYDWISQQGAQQSTTDNNLNASFSVNTALTSNLDVSFAIANGFRYPTLSERFFKGPTPRGDIIGNQQLKSETSLGAQTTFNWYGSNQLSVHSAVYHYKLDNYIERYRTQDDTLTYRNLASASIRGFEAEVRFNSGEYLQHHVTYQQQQGEDDLNQPLADLHPKKLAWITQLNYQEMTIVNSLSYQFDATNVNESEVQRDDFWLWDLSIAYQLSQNHSLSLALNNVTNTLYFGSLDEDAAYQPKRNVRLSTNWRF